MLKGVSLKYPAGRVQESELKRAGRKDLATTYSRGTYRTTTIGNAVFDGRVRDGIGSGHSFMATKKVKRLVTGDVATREDMLRSRCHRSALLVFQR